MIEQLQKRLSLLLSSVSIFLLLFLLGFIYFFNRNSQYSAVEEALSSAVSKPMYRSESASYPIYQIFMTEKGEILEQFGEDYFLENDTAEQLVKAALLRINNETESFFSSINSGQIQYYCKKDSPPGNFDTEEKKHGDGQLYRIALTDFSKEIKSMNRLSAVLITLFFALSFLIIVLSRFFVGKTVRPVKEAMLSQRQFVSDASHELKTPLTVIINNVGNLQKSAEKLSAVRNKDRSLPGEEKEAVELSLVQNMENNIRGIAEMSSRMKRLTESLLDLSRLENLQDRKNQLEKLSLSHITEQECLYFEALFYDQGKNLEYKIEEELFTLGNENKLKELLSILLENALKYSLPETATCLRLKKKKNALFLTLSNAIEKDLSKEERQNLFKRFYRLDEAHSGGEGYGLGLAIAREIVLMHKGEIRVESGKNQISFLIRFNVF